MHRVLLITALIALSAACVTPRMEPFQLTDDPTAIRPEVDAKLLGDKDILVIKDDSRWLVRRSTQFGWAHHTQAHQILQILTEDGVDQVANQLLKIPPLTKLIRLEARTIAPDGSVFVVTPEQVFADERKAQSAKFEFGKDDTQSFRFPRVAVGSVLEYIVETEGPGGAEFSSEDIASRENAHLLSQRSEMEFDEMIRYRFRVYNAEPKVETQDLGKFRRIVIESTEPWTKVKPIPYAPSESFRQPRWIFRHKQTAAGGYTAHHSTTWKDVVEGDAGVLYHQHATKLVDAPPWALNASCADTTCWIQAGLDEMRTKTRLSDLGGSVGGIRSLKHIVETGESSGYERAWWLFKLLESQGVPAEFAFSIRRNTNALDMSVPSGGVFNHLLLVVKDGERDIWIDPSCDFCSVGQLPDRTLDQPALLVVATDRAFLSPEAAASWTTATGAKTAAASDESSYELTLQENGDVDVNFTQIVTGLDAETLWLESRDKSSHEAKEAARNWAEGVFPTAELVSYEAPACDSRAGRCVSKRSVRLKGMLIQDRGDVLFRPNAFDGADWSLLATGERKMPVVFDRTADKNVKMRLTFPASWKLQAKAKTDNKTSAASRYSTRWAMDGKAFVIERSLGFDAGWFKPEQGDELAQPFEAYKIDRAQSVRFTGRLNNAKIAPMPEPEPTPEPAPVVDPDKVVEPEPAPAG